MFEEPVYRCNCCGKTFSKEYPHNAPKKSDKIILTICPNCFDEE